MLDRPVVVNANVWHGLVAGHTALFLLVAHLFVLWYEEPTLRRTFGQEYDAYCRRVRRWLPRLSSGES